MGLHTWTLQHPVRWDSGPRIADRRVHFPYLEGSRNRARAPNGSSGLAVRRRISGGDFIISACLFHNCSPRFILFDLLKFWNSHFHRSLFRPFYLYLCRLSRYSSSLYTNPLTHFSSHPALYLTILSEHNACFWFPSRLAGGFAGCRY